MVSIMEPSILVFVFLLETVLGQDSYTESLLIKPLEDGNVYTHFEFKTTWDYKEGSLSELSVDMMT